MKKNNFHVKFKNKIMYCIILAFLFFYFLPFILFRTNSIVTIHDNLDCIIPYYKMYKDNGLFFKFDAPTKGFSEMSTLYYGHVNFSITPLLYYFFDDFIAYAVNNYLYIILGFLSMYLLLRKMKSINPLLIISISVCYAILPVGPNLGIAVGTLPLIIVIFIHFMFENKFSWKILFILFYPVISSFTMTGIFILGFWFLGLVVLGIKNKRINPNLLIGFILLCIAYVLVDLRLFYVMFILKTPLNRNIFSFYPDGIIAQLKVFLRELKNYGAHGYYHAASFQRKIIIPLAFFVSLPCLTALIRRARGQPGTLAARIKTILAETNETVKQLFLAEFIVFIFCCIAALYDSGLMSSLIKKIIPMLSGFNWGRLWIFNRVLWHVVFALCLQLVLRVDLIVLEGNFDCSSKMVKFPKFLIRLIVGILVCLQVGYIALDLTYYNDQIQTWRNAAKTAARKIMPNRDFSLSISYKEFFAEDLFNRIKKDISYSNEMVVAFGYHPSVLMYNSFNCIDGYNNTYPLSYMQKFRTLIAPELETNKEARDYYDSWGGRMYLYNSGPNSGLNFEPTRDKNTPPIELNIDMEVFKNDFNGVYILSRAEVSNSDALGLDLVKRYYDEESIYTIYLYKCK